MAVERASFRAVHKPWGSTDLRPWSELQGDGIPIGELWFQRADLTSPPPALLLKLLFTNEALSIQVHPDDAFAQSIGMAHGKTEAWYILSAEPGAKVAVGLKGPAYRSAIASVHRGRLDCGLGSMAPGPEGRRHFRASGHDPCHRSGARDRRNPTAKRRDFPPFRLWPAAGTSRRQRRGVRTCRAGRMPIHSEAPHRCQNSAGRQLAFRA